MTGRFVFVHPFLEVHTASTREPIFTLAAVFVMKLRFG